jgi:hypothetical protein
VSTISDTFMVNTRSDSSLNANAPSSGASNQVSNFVTIQSFGTFAIASSVLKTIWELLRSLAGAWADSYWTPFVICMVYGAWQFAISVLGDNRVTGLTPTISALVIGSANSAILAASIIGLTETTNEQT